MADLQPLGLVELDPVDHEGENSIAIGRFSLIRTDAEIVPPLEDIADTSRSRRRHPPPPLETYSGDAWGRVIPATGLAL